MKKFRKAFTIIELMISIIIFWVGILVILNILNKNIFFAKKVQIQTQATLLAKDAMEIVYNIRDTNYIRFRQWNYLTWTNGTEQYFSLGKSYKVYTLLTWDGNILEKVSNPNFLTTRLYVLTWTFTNSVWETIYSGFYYNYFTGEKTPFWRYITFTGVYLAPEGSTKNDYILKVISVVPYKFWGYYGKINLESFISWWRWKVK